MAFMTETVEQAATRVRVETAGHALGPFRDRATMAGGSVAECAWCNEVFDAVILDKVAKPCHPVIKREVGRVILKIEADDLISALKRAIEEGGTVLTITLPCHHLVAGDELVVSLKDMGGGR